MSPLFLHLLGEFCVERDGERVPESAWGTQKVKSLLKILVTHRGPVPRDRLLEWLWPDSGRAAGDAGLRAAVSRLRRALEPDLPPYAPSNYVRAESGSYRFDPPAETWIDVEHFSAGYARGRQLEPSGMLGVAALAYEQARALYRGDYLEEDRYADWAIAERERLRELRFALLTRLAEVLARQGRYRAALTCCRDVLAADPCRESTWAQLMLYHYHAGDRAAALRAFEECRAALRRELGVAPLPETIAVEGLIRRGEVTGEGRYPPAEAIERLRRLPLSLGRMPFVGRESECAWLASQVEEAGAGRGRVVVVEGEAGMGKSRLAVEFVGDSRHRGLLGFEGQCRESDAGLPFQPVLEAFRGWAAGAGSDASRLVVRAVAEQQPRLLAGLSDLLPELVGSAARPAEGSPLSPEQEKARRMEALSELLIAVAQSAGPLPLILFLDDLQWADSSILEFIGHFSQRLATEPILVLGVFRSEDVDGQDSFSRLLLELRRRGVLERLALKPLSAESTVRLVQAMAGPNEWGRRLGRALHAEAEGNPLYLVSILQTLFEEGQLALSESGEWQAPSAAEPAQLLDGLASPPTMQQVIQRRLDRLADEERQALEAAAVLGSEFDWDTLRQMRAWRPDALLDSLDRLRGSLLIRERGAGRHAFTHDKIREAVYEAMPQERRTWLHRRAGEAMEAAWAARLDEAAGTVAQHFERAGALDRALGFRLRAGRHAARAFALPEAIAHYEAALGLVEERDMRPPDGAVQDAHERLGDLCQASGKYGAAAVHFEAAIAGANAPGRVRLLYKQAHNFDRQGSRARAGDLLRIAVSEALSSEAPDGVERARVLARWSILNSAELGQARSVEHARQSVVLLQGRTGGEAVRPLDWAEYDAVHGVLINAGETFRHWGLWAEAADHFEWALEIAERQGDPVGIGYSAHNQADVLLAQGEFDRARALYSRAAREFGQSGQAWEEMSAHTHLGLARACEGRWPEANGSFEKARAIGEGIEPTESLCLVYLLLSLAALRCSCDEGQAREMRDRAAGVGPLETPLLMGLMELSASNAEACAGRTEGAGEHYRTARDLWGQDHGNRYLSPWLLAACRPASLPGV